MNPQKFYVIVFDSTHFAISTEKRLGGCEGIVMVPTPREITASCGLSIKFPAESLECILKALDSGPREGMTLYWIDRTCEAKRATLVEWR